MTAWILVALAITAGLVAMCAELLARRVAALVSLAATATFVAAALASLHAPSPVVAVFVAYTIGFLVLAAVHALRRHLPPYVVGSDDEEA